MSDINERNMVRIGAIACLVAIVFGIVAPGCKNNDAGENKKKQIEAVYFDYQVMGEEGRDFVTVLIQFREGDAEGNTLLLSEPAKVELDGEVLQADSAKRSGAYYEAHYDIEGFAGNHTITFTDLNKKQFKEQFSFAPIRLRQELPEKVKQDSFSIYIEGVEPGTKVRYVLADTSFETDDVNEVQEMSSTGRIIFNKSEMSKVKPGPVALLLSLEDEKPVKNGTRAGGRVYISYSLRRDFELVR